MTKKFCSGFFSLCLTLVAFNPLAEATQLTDEMKDVGCYQVTLPQSPENLPAEALLSKTETWCYAEFEGTSEFRRLIFNADGPNIKPELALLIRRDGTFTHGSLYGGELTIHRLHDIGVNPFPVPLTPPARLNKSRTIRNRWLHQINEVLETLSRADINRTAATRRITEGTFEAKVPEAVYPRTAYWWPHKGVPLAAGAYSPLGKYDAYVAARTGTNPKSSEWELANHSLQNVPWGGHCNGWAASTFLYKAIPEPLWDPLTKMVLLKSDIDGMRAEASFCVNWAFYGKRYNVATDDINDIYPDRFHAVLLYYIGNLKKPIAFDHYRNEGVDNNVISGYRFTITKDATDPLVFHVNALIQAHAYPQQRDERDDVASIYSIYYDYDLTTDAEGNVVSGTWKGYNNPDFLWVPLSQSKCGRENPRIDAAKIDEMVATLKKATVQKVDLKFVLDRAMPASESVDVTLTAGAIPGMFIKGYTKGGDSPDDSLGIVVGGFTGYPTLNDTGLQEKYLDWPQMQGPVPGSYNGPLNQISKISLRNYKSDLPTNSTHFEIGEIEFLGGD